MKILKPLTVNSFGSAKAQGFTLIELLMVIVVLGVVLSVGIPNFFGTVQNARMTSQTNQALGMIAYARSEAAKRPGTTISLCASGTTTSATPVCDTSNWEEGWFIMADQDNDQVLDAATDEILRIGEPLSGGNTLRTSGFDNNDFLTFDSTGIPDSSGTFTICDERGETSAKAIVLSIIGHARVAVDDERDEDAGEEGDNIVNNNAGGNISCPA